ncbi:MAG TPA: S41 family peptidase [Fulvivirga sp.]|nr:S41 family peptidase [Fulvivirga sp.]
MKSIKVRLLLVFTLLIGVMAFISPSDRFFSIARNLDIFASVFKEVDKYYVDETDPNQLIEVAIDSMLASLDPYTNYIPQEDAESFKTFTTGEYAGIGAQITIIDSSVYISMLYPGFAAQKAGLKIGDQLLSMDDTGFAHKTVSQVSTILKGKSKTSAILKVKRTGVNDTLSFNIQREKISIKNVPYYGMVDNSNVGYIRLDDFTTGAGKEVQSAVKELISSGAKSIILDLRDNPGGLLNEAINVANVFIPKNKLVVFTKGKVKEWNRSYKTLNNPVDNDIPLAVLVNEESASASEIVAGVIQDYDRGILIGNRTFGKGLVQSTRPLSYNTQLKVTTAKYYIPSGRCIQALDYSHRDENGNVNQIPDSLYHKFKTKGGRQVFDGGGLFPDIEVAGESLAPISVDLLTKGLIFIYANKYFVENGALDNWHLKKGEYQNFLMWLDERGFTYKSTMQSEIESLITSAKDENYYDRMKKEINELQKELSKHNYDEIHRYQPQIIRLLEQGIAMHMQLEAGAIIYLTKNDRTIKTAIGKLNNNGDYKQILTRK